MKRSFFELNSEYESKRAKKSDRDDLLRSMNKWCLYKGIKISPKVKFGPGCAGHGLLSVEKIEEGEELVLIPRSATLHHSDRLENEFKKFTKIKNHPWISVILSLMAEWSYADSKWRSYIDWLPDVGTLTLPHNWSNNYAKIIDTIGLKEHIDDDRERMDQDFQLALTFIKKNEKLFPYTDQEIRTLYYHCAFLMMSYSFTDPEDEEESGSEINLVEGDIEKPEPRRFMLPVGDLLNHTWDNNARIEFGDDCLTINATKAIEPDCEIFNTFGDMSNSRLLQMYGFTEEKNPYDDVYIPDDVIKTAIERHEVDAKDAKIKLLNSLGFFSEVRLSSNEELDDQLRAVLAVSVMNRKQFNKMVKDTKKKSTNGQIEELEVEIDSNLVSDLEEKEKEIFLEILSGTKGRLEKLEIPLDQSEDADSNADLIGQFLNHLRDGSLDLLRKCV